MRSAFAQAAHVPKTGHLLCNQITLHPSFSVLGAAKLREAPASLAPCYPTKGFQTVSRTITRLGLASFRPPIPLGVGYRSLSLRSHGPTLEIVDSLCGGFPTANN